MVDLHILSRIEGFMLVFGGMTIVYINALPLSSAIVSRFLCGN